MAVGRISGPLLKANLLRNGVDLAFETNLLYLDVNNLRIGVKTNTPTHELTVNGTTRTTRLETTNELTIGDITVSGNTIESSASQLTLNPIGADPVVYQQKLVVDTFDIEANSITSNTADTDIELSANGTGQVKIFSNTLINGNLHATGTITADGGTITLGDSNTDNVVFNADVNSNILPNQSITYDLGSTSKRWNEVWADTAYITDVDVTGSFTLNNVDLTLRPGNTLYVSTNGNDTYTGTHQNDPYRTIKKALTVATSGTTIYIYPGVYSEIFPLTVPVGVTVKGSGIRSVNIQPTVGTISQDAFLVNGETTIEDLTVSGFRYNSGANTGHAFRFASNFLVTSRSPYIRNITIITTGSVTSVGDPRGFNQGDAGRGAYLDGSIVNSASKEATMLFHSCTFITPGVDTITATDGVRVEWLNSFTYFATRGFYGLSGSTGFAGTGKTQLRLTGTTGTFTVGDVVTYYSTFPTALSTGTISSIASDGKISLTGKVTGLEKSAERGGKIVIPNGNAKISTAIKKFGTGSLALSGSVAGFLTNADVAGTGVTITASGNAQLSTVQKKFGTFSLLLDGTGDYLSIASNTDYGFGTEDFTIEGWFYKTAVTTQYLFDTRTTLTENSVAVQSQGNGTLRLSVNGAFVLTSSNAHTNNAWNHLAISRASGVTRFFINGVVSTTTYTDATNYGTAKPLVIGAQYNGTTAFNGYIDEFRVTKGLARYTGTFTPSTTAFTGDSSTKLLLHMDGTSDYLAVASSADFAFGAGEFTLEAWVYNTSITGSNQIIFDFRTIDPSWAPTLYLQATTNTIRLAANGNVLVETAFALLTNTWYHIALSKSSGNTRIFINGIQSGPTYTDSNTYIQGPLTLGARFDSTAAFVGYIDDVRISKGIGRYTTTFTAPVSAAPNDSYTKLLLRLNGENNSTTFTDETILVQDIRSNTGATATGISLVDHSDFGVEVRSIASANVYGTYGVVGNGLGVVMYLIGQNFAYIGTGLRSDNDVTYVIQANETVETNGAKIYYSSVDHKGDFRIGDLFYVNQADGTVNFTSANFNVSSSQGFTFTNGVNTTYIDGNEISTGNLKLSGNTLSSTSGAVNVLSANDQINLLNNVSITGNLDVMGDVTIGGNIIVGDQTTDTISIVAGVSSDIIPTTDNTYDIGASGLAWQDLFVTTGYVGNISVSTNQITTTTTNSNLVISGNGSGTVAVEGLVISNNDISSTSNANITLTPNGTGIVEINSVRSLKIPVGDNSERPATAQAGMIRFNSTYSRYEGYNGSNWVFLDGLSDLDNNTKITAELTPGANDNTIRFYSDGTVIADLNATRLNVVKVTVDDIAIDGSSITNTAGGNLSLQASGTGVVQIENFAVNGSSITNTLNNSITTFTTTGTGYVKIDGAAGVVIPSGLPAFRPGNPIVGMTRFDTGAGRLEIYDGVTWVSAAGASSGITTADAQDLALQYAIALG